jgi:glucose dehydrogenase
MNATNKGVAIAAGRVVRGTQDGFLFALDAKTGDAVVERQIADWRIGEGIGAAPTIWNGLVYIAKAGGDWGIQGRMMAFRLDDGAPAWHFDLIPTGTQANADTWKTPGSAEHGGGASWVAYALDRETGTIFVPVGNPGPITRRRCARARTRTRSRSSRSTRRRARSSGGTSSAPTTTTTGTRPTCRCSTRAAASSSPTSGKQGILHVVDRTTGALVFKLPVTDHAQPGRAAHARGRARLPGRGRAVERRRS